MKFFINSKNPATGSEKIDGNFVGKIPVMLSEKTQFSDRYNSGVDMNVQSNHFPKS